MINFISHSNKIFSLTGVIIALIFLQACGTNPTVNRPATVKTQSLESLLKQAQQATGEEKQPLLIQAAGLLVLERRYEKAQEILVHINQQQLTPLQLDDFNLYYGETLLALTANEQALKHLQSVYNLQAKSVAWQIRHAQSLSDAYLANFNYFEAAKLRIELDDIIDTSEALTANNEKIWLALNQLETHFLQSLISDFNTQRVNGWLEIAYINKRWGYYPEKLLSEINQWKMRYPLHPSMVNQPRILQKAEAAEAFNPAKIAVLLPLSGKLGNIGMMIKDGILAAHYQVEDAQTAPQLNFYDTAHSLSALTPYNNAVADGADFIIGPLTKEAIETILNQETINTPILALNRLEEQKYAHNQIYQFGLPIEDEAIQAASYAYEKGFRKALAILPATATGNRARLVFQETFEDLGGEVVYIQEYRETSQLKKNVQRLLGVDSSIERKRALQQLLGRNLEFEMRRRKDADFIFMLASPTEGRTIKPFINYYFAHDLPVISTSSIYSGKLDPQTDIDLNGIEFPVIPLLLSELPQFKESRDALATTLPSALDGRGQYFSLGFDSYSILKQLSILQAFPDYKWSGLGGELGVDDNGLVHRALTWAQFNRGVPHVTKEREIRELNSQKLNPLPTDESPAPIEAGNLTVYQETGQDE
ncbi:penicillin-binding protein activator [Aliikangiella maris]|uniref:Penicillin-binding protein activator n=2 Tax=Aliikangiella maris TaxID=3162458 RepID=A0ABV2BPZ7_9GAMM